jgi:hypothetical protein
MQRRLQKYVNSNSFNHECVSLVDRYQRLRACGFETKLHRLDVESILNLSLVIVEVSEDFEGSCRRKTEKDR